MLEVSTDDGSHIEDLREGFLLGEWTVSPLDGRLQRGDVTRRIQPKAMDVLMALARSDGTVVERDDLLRAVWGERAVSDEPLTRCIGDLRRALGDKRDNPTHIETIPKRGYRLLLPVRPLEDRPSSDEPEPVADSAPLKTTQTRPAWLTAMLVVAAIASTLMLAREWHQIVPEPSAPVATDPKNSPAIAVLPFLNLSANPTDAFMADGTAETLTHVLAHIDGLKVVARSSAFVFREAEDVRVIGDALGVDVVLEGSIQVLGEAMRITAQLVATDDGHHLWSAAYDQPVQELFSVQEQIADDVATALQLTVLRDEGGLSERTAGFEAYREYLLGLERLQERTAASIRTAERHFSRARVLDETYALAHVGYAEAISLQHYYMDRPISEIKSIALPAIDEALALDPGLGEAYAALGFILFNDNDIAGAESAFRRAVVLSPNYARAWFGYGTLYNDTGRPEKALAMHLRALELNPLAPHINNAVAVAYEKRGEFEKAVAQFERTMEIAPDYSAARYRLAALKWNVEGDAAVAFRLYEQAISADPENPRALGLLARLYLDLGAVQRAGDMLTSAEVSSGGAVSGEIRALLLTREGAAPELRLQAAEAFFGEVTQFGVTSRYLRIVRDAYAEQGDPTAALALIQRIYPELFEKPRKVDWINFSVAVDLAQLLQLNDQQSDATELLDIAENYIADLPRLGCCGFGISDVEIAALKGETDRAVALLESAVDAGWKADWWLETRYNPNLAVLAEHPGFKAILSRLEADMVERRTAVFANPS